MEILQMKECQPRTMTIVLHYLKMNKNLSFHSAVYLRDRSNVSKMEMSLLLMCT